MEQIMSDKEEIKHWLNCLANDDYVEADKLFPNVVNSALNSVINNKKPAIIKQLSAEVEESAIEPEKKDNSSNEEAKKE
jgi:hypothetical protein